MVGTEAGADGATAAFCAQAPAGNSKASPRPASRPVVRAPGARGKCFKPCVRRIAAPYQSILGSEKNTMPELPEVEVTRRSVAGGLLGARVRDVQMGLPLRWPLGHDPRALVGTACGEMSRRGKYLWLPLSRGADDPTRHLPGL